MGYILFNHQTLQSLIAGRQEILFPPGGVGHRSAGLKRHDEHLELIEARVVLFSDFGVQSPVIQPLICLGGHQALGRHGHGQGASWGLGSNGRTPGIQHIIVNGSPGEHSVIKPAGALYVWAEQLLRFREASLEDVKEAFSRRQAVVPGAQEFRFFFLMLQCFELGWAWGGENCLRHAECCAAPNPGPGCRRRPLPAWAAGCWRKPGRLEGSFSRPEKPETHNTGPIWPSAARRLLEASGRLGAKPSPWKEGPCR